MTVEMAIALVGFAFVMSITPGPSNILLLASGANFGFVRSVPLILGISAGFLAMVIVVGLGLGPVFARFPELYVALRLVCAAYVLWLAIKIARSRGMGATDGSGVEKPIGFLAAAALQLVNPKAWAVALIVTVSYIVPGQFLGSLAAMVVIFALVNIPSIGVWAVAGALLQETLSRGRRIVIFNIAMAVILVASMAPVLLGLH